MLTGYDIEALKYALEPLLRRGDTMQLSETEFVNLEELYSKLNVALFPYLITLRKRKFFNNSKNLSFNFYKKLSKHRISLKSYK